MTNKIDLSGRNAVVTGGAQGIGRAIVERFVDSGATVAIWDRDVALAKKTATELQKRGRVVSFAVDVTDYSDVERAREETIKALTRIDILVNNAASPDRTRRPGNIRWTHGAVFFPSIWMDRFTVVAPWHRR
jgi:3-oxoacyl-[acyl-carrier protein] reductase